MRNKKLSRQVGLLLLALTCPPLLASADAGTEVTGLPVDVQQFIERRDLCDHFRGEDPYDQERRKFLEENMDKYCTGTDKALAALKARYASNRAVQQALGKYEENIEPAK